MFKPEVEMEGIIIHITLEFHRIEAYRKQFERVVFLAINRNYDETIVLAADLIEQSPHVYEHLRILGQIQSEPDKKIAPFDNLIDGL